MIPASTTGKKYFIYFFLFLLLSSFAFLPGCKKARPPYLPQSQINQFHSATSVTVTEKITFAVFGDNRPSSPLLSQPRTFKKILTQIKKHHPDVVISTGDSVYGSLDRYTYEKQYQEFVSLIEEIKLPFFVALGNHDSRSKEGIKLYQKYFSPETYFSFKINDALFIVLDTETQPGKVNKKQLQWLKETLKKSKCSNIFVFLHRPPFSLMNPQSEKNKHLSFVDLKNRDQLVSILKKAKVKIVFAGHEHFFNQSNFQGLKQIITGCAGASPYADFSHGGLAHFVLVVAEKGDLKIKVIDENGKYYPPERFKTPVFP